MVPSGRVARLSTLIYAAEKDEDVVPATISIVGVSATGRLIRRSVRGGAKVVLAGSSSAVSITQIPDRVTPVRTTGVLGSNVAMGARNGALMKAVRLREAEIS